MVKTSEHLPPMSSPAAGFQPDRDLPTRFSAFYRTLHDAFAERARGLAEERRSMLKASLEGKKPGAVPVAEASPWTAALPDWSVDQRNLVLAPADDVAAVVTAMNAGAAGIVVDLEDSVVNTLDHTLAGITTAVGALYGELTAGTAHVRESRSVVWMRVRGVHLSQAGIVDVPTPAALFDLALLVYRLDFSRLEHAPAIVVPKLETVAEAEWWRDVMAAIAASKSQPAGAIKCLVQVESHPIVYHLDAAARALGEHIIGFAYDPVDYVASFAHYHLENPEAVIPDRATLTPTTPLMAAPHAAVVAAAHEHGLLALGACTSAFAERPVAEQQTRALEQMKAEKQVDARAGYDGGWTVVADHSAAATALFPAPNQLARHPPAPPAEAFRPALIAAGARTIQGTRAAARTAIRYRLATLTGRGMTPIDGQLETLAGDRLARLMIAQRFLHGMHKAGEITRFFDEELARLLVDPNSMKQVPLLREARRQAEEMVRQGYHNPI